MPSQHRLYQNLSNELPYANIQRINEFQHSASLFFILWCQWDACRLNQTVKSDVLTSGAGG